MTNNLNGPRVAPTQTQKEQTINDSIGRIDAALTNFYPYGWSDNEVIPADTLRSTFAFILTPGNVTAAWSLFVPAGVERGLFFVLNASGFSCQLTIENSPIIGVTIPHQESRLCALVAGGLFSA